MLGELRRRLEAVEDGPTFPAFVDALVADRTEAVRLDAQEPSSPYGPDRGGWENIKIETYLDAAVRCAEAHLRAGEWVIDLRMTADGPPGRTGG